MNKISVTKKDNKLYCTFYNFNYKKTSEHFKKNIIEEFVLYSMEENRILSLDQALEDYFIEDVFLTECDLGIFRGKIEENNYYEKKLLIFKGDKVEFKCEEFQVVLNFDKFIPIKVLTTLDTLYYYPETLVSKKYNNIFYIDPNVVNSSRTLGAIIHHLQTNIDLKNDMIICTSYLLK